MAVPDSILFCHLYYRKHIESAKRGQNNNLNHLSDVIRICLLIYAVKNIILLFIQLFRQQPMSNV
jgi:hypothetical protein